MSPPSNRRSPLIACLAVLALSACAGISPQEFHKNPAAASDFEVCKSMLDPESDPMFVSSLRQELARRRVYEANCQVIVRKREHNVAAGVLAGVAVVAAVASSRSRGAYVGVGVGTTIDTSPDPAPVSDYDWEWDQFYDTANKLVWTCRGVQTGQMGDPSRCAAKQMTDWKWPDKRAF
jgi:hypothetical protein